MALSVLTSAIERGELSPGDTVIEYTGGSTGTALAFVSAVLGQKNYITIGVFLSS